MFYLLLARPYIETTPNRFYAASEWLTLVLSYLVLVLAGMVYTVDAFLQAGEIIAYVIYASWALCVGLVSLTLVMELKAKWRRRQAMKNHKKAMETKLA